MSGKKSKDKRKRAREEAEQALAESLRHEPEFIQAVNDYDELWQRGKVAIVIPAIRDDYPAKVKNAIDRRRRANLSGRCDCGARQYIGKKGHIEFRHADDCMADDESIIRELKRTIVRSWDQAWAVVLSDYEGDPEPHMAVFQDRETAQGSLDNTPDWLKPVTELYPAYKSPELIRFLASEVLQKPDNAGYILLEEFPPSVAADLRRT